MEVAIIGGGAAGFFAAISCRTHHPGSKVTIYEKTNKLLSKVKVSGGGRCNVTHACFSLPQLSKYYPRGGRQLKKALGHFSTKDTVNWYEQRGVKLKTEEDNRMFPVTDSSQTVIDCLLNEAKRLGVSIKIGHPVEEITENEGGFKIRLKGASSLHVNKVIIATGGSPREAGFNWIKKLGHSIVSPVPSLFTFNMPNEPIKELKGVVASPVSVRVQGTKLSQEGPLLITHWGMSGPAILKLSAWGARELAALDYQFKVQVNWLGEPKEEEVREQLHRALELIRKRKVSNRNPFNLVNRLWDFLLEKNQIDPNIKWGELGKKNLNRLLNTLLNDEYTVSGKTTFKEEFVTCGGVDLSEVSFSTMESRVCSGLYFAGEVLDIDGVTGGFNFQAAWTTGFIAGKLSS